MSFMGSLRERRRIRLPKWPIACILLYVIGLVRPSQTCAAPATPTGAAGQPCDHQSSRECPVLVNPALPTEDQLDAMRGPVWLGADQRRDKRLRAEQLIKNGEGCYSRSDYDCSLRAWKAARSLLEDMIGYDELLCDVILKIARSHRKKYQYEGRDVNQLQLAHEAYRVYLEMRKGDSNLSLRLVEAEDRAIVAMLAELEKIHATARLEIEEQKLRIPNVPVDEPGPHRVVVTSKGYVIDGESVVASPRRLLVALSMWPQVKRSATVRKPMTMVIGGGALTLLGTAAISGLVYTGRDRFENQYYYGAIAVGAATHSAGLSLLNLGWRRRHEALSTEAQRTIDEVSDHVQIQTRMLRKKRTAEATALIVGGNLSILFGAAGTGALVFRGRDYYEDAAFYGAATLALVSTVGGIAFLSAGWSRLQRGRLGELRATLGRLVLVPGLPTKGSWVRISGRF